MSCWCYREVASQDSECRENEILSRWSQYVFFCWINSILALVIRPSCKETLALTAVVKYVERFDRTNTVGQPLQVSHLDCVNSAGENF